MCQAHYLTKSIYLKNTRKLVGFRKQFYIAKSHGISPGHLNIEAFSTATRSFDVWVIENKFTGQFVFYVVHFGS